MRSRIPSGLVALLLLAGCADHPAAPEPLSPAPPPDALQALTCSADVRGREMRCGEAGPSLGAASGSIIGGQGVNVRLTSRNVAYDSAAQVFRMEVTIQNLMDGTLGTYDGQGVAGIRIFFQADPVVLAGAGEVAVSNSDGQSFYLGAGESFFNYAAMLPPDAVSEPREWRFSVPNQVERFSFTVLLESPVFRTPPTPVHGNFVQMTAGASHSCGRTLDERLFCWGNGGDGRLGHGGYSTFLDPAPVASDGVRWRTVSAGSEHTCGVTTDDQALCWGKGFSPAPGLMTGSMAVDSLDAGGGATCATVQGAAWCWGANESGQLGTGDRTPRAQPAAVSGGHAFVDVSVGGRHACGLTAGGEAWCWGENGFGQLGAAGAQDCGEFYRIECSTTPVRVDTEVRFTAIDAGFLHTCALDEDGAAYCWGNNVYEQVGDLSTTDRSRPVRVAATTERFRQIVAMQRNSCGIASSGAADCWGTHETIGQDVDQMVAGQHWRSIAGLDVHLCGAAADGRGYCSGREQFGELGNLGTHQNAASQPVQLAPLHLVDLPPRAGFDYGQSNASITAHAQTDHLHRPFTTYSDDDYGIVSRIWSFGDGTTVEGNFIEHLYAANGTYTLTLTVVDGAGQRAMKSTNVVIDWYPE